VNSTIIFKLADVGFVAEGSVAAGESATVVVIAKKPRVVRNTRTRYRV
jgi:hypothetical protein